MVQVSYPGVYIQEVPSGVRTVAGVATSITAFIGAAPRGPTDTPVTITSFGDYDRQFGGLSLDSTMSYAVRDFYANGGTQAIIARVTNGGVAASVGLSAGSGSLQLEAASVGSWGDRLRVAVEQVDPDLFNLRLVELSEDLRTEKVAERFLNLSVNTAHARFVPRVLEQNSQLARVRRDGSGAWLVPGVRPDQTLGSPPMSPPGTELRAFNGGDDGSVPSALSYLGSAGNKTGLYALEKADLFNLLCIPPPQRDADTDPTVYQAAMGYCARRRAFLIVDPPAAWTTVAAPLAGLDALGLSGPDARNAAIYFPRVIQSDPLREGQPDVFVPCGIIAGLMARTDAQRGVWKAPAGLDAALSGIQGIAVSLTDNENGQLNPRGINCLRAFPVNGRVVWGARTLRGADQLADEYKYIPVRRIALFIEESLYRGTQWVVFEPNDEPLWAQIRLNVGAFMHGLFRQNAFQGMSPREAYLVKCDSETTTQNDINLGIVNILVGFAPLKPAEFVIIRIQQLAGQIEA